MVEAGGSVPDYKAFRSISTPASVSMLTSNLSSKEGTSFLTCKNSSEGGRISLYGQQIVGQEQDKVEPSFSQVTHKSDCIRAQFHKVNGTWFAVVCHLHVAIIFNANLTRRLFSYEITQAIQSASGRPADNSNPVQNRIWFTCSAKAFDQDSGQEFLTLATNDGRVFSITVQGGGAQFVADCAFTMALQTPIVSMASDSRSKVLMLGTGTGQTMFMKPKIEEDWDVVQAATTSTETNAVQNNPITCADVLSLGLPMFVVGYASGTVKLFLCETGQLVCEIGAHSRQVNAVCAHPSRTVFVTAGDDTFVNLWEVQGSTIERLDISLLTSSIVNDYQVVGLAFGQENYRSIVGSVYDYKVLLVWDDIL